MKCIASWKKYCSDYEIKEWNENNLDLSTNIYTRQAYEAKAWGFVPDYLRLWIVYTCGGIYLDTDVQMVRSFDPLLNEKGFAGFEDDDHIAFGLAFGAEAGNSLIEENMHAYDDLRFINEDGSINRTPSPEYTTAIMKKLGFSRNTGKIQRVDGFACYPPEYFCPKNFSTGILKLTKNTYSIHQFDASWYTEAEQAQKLRYWKKAKWDYWLHMPNRIARNILGDERYEGLKRVLKK